MSLTTGEYWQEALGSWALYLRSASKPATTLGLREYQMLRFAKDHPDVLPWDVTLDHLTDWLGAFTWAPETRRSYRAALRSFYHWAHITGRVAVDPAALLPTVPVAPREPHPTPEAFFREALRCASPRVQIMVELGGFVGLRRGEICLVHSDDVEPDLGGEVLFVHGKGRRERRVPLLPGLARELRARPRGFIFPGAIDGHLSPHYVGKLISAMLPDGWSTHSLRHRFGSKFFEAERDLRATQTVLGHASVVTTQIYTKVPAGALWNGIGNVA